MDDGLGHICRTEEKASEAEFYLRDERRKTAKLERMLEQVRKEAW